MRLDGAVAVDLTLAGQPHLLLVADAGQHRLGVGGEVDLLHQGLGAEVLHAFFDEHPAGAAQPVAHAVEHVHDRVERAEHGAVDGDAGLAGLFAQVGPLGNFDFLFLIDKDYLGHGKYTLQGWRCRGHCTDCPVAGHQEWRRAGRAKQEGAFAVPPAEKDSVRLAHFSDVHVTARRPRWRREDWFNKRFAAWFNLRLLGRGSRFRQAEEVLTALQEAPQLRRPDRLIFTGDATAMGFDEELARAAPLLLVDRFPGLAVPGNHDYCTRAAMLSGDFERHFAPWQVGERVDGETYPFAQKVGPVWLVAVNSATANRWAWDARGAVGPAHLQPLEPFLRPP